MGAIFTNIAEIFANSGWAQIFFAEGGWKYAVMIGVACVLLYLAIVHQFEPLLLLPIGFGMLMTNLPLDGIFHMDIFINETQHINWELLGTSGGMADYIYLGVKLGIYPPLIFLGIGTMTDFEPLIARPSSLLLGAAAQLGIFFTFVGAKSWASPTRKPLPSASSAVPTARPLSSSPPAWPRTCWVPSRLPRTATWRWCLLSSRPS